MPAHTTSILAGGNIYPSRFIKISTSADNTALQAGSNEDVIGISTEATKDAPLSGASAYAGVDTYQMHYYPNGTECLLEIGSGGVTRGDYLKSDTNGKGVSAATTGPTAQFIGAQALESAAAGDFARVMVMRIPKYYPALS